MRPVQRGREDRRSDLPRLQGHGQAAPAAGGARLVMFGDLDIEQVTTPHGRRLLVVTNDIDYADPESGDGNVGTSQLDRRETEQLRDELNEILERW